MYIFIINFHLSFYFIIEMESIKQKNDLEKIKNRLNNVCKYLMVWIKQSF